MERNSLKSVVMTVISYAVTLAGIAFFLSITATPGSAYMLVFALPLLFAIRLSASRSAGNGRRRHGKNGSETLCG